MKQHPMKRFRLKTALAVAVAFGWGVGVAHAQTGGGGGTLLPPVFNTPVHFDADVGFPFGLAATDFLDASGNPGQDGYPEIAVAGAGVHLFEPDGATDCSTSPLPHFINIYHNLGADPNFAWDGPNADQALSLVQTLDIGTADPEMWAMELAFADVTGINGPDLVLVGQDPDVPTGFLVVFKNNGDGTFNPTPQVWFTSVPLEGVVVKDFDLDGDIDVIASSSNLHPGWECADYQVSEQDAVVVFQNTTSENHGVFGFNPKPPTDLGIPGNFAPGDIASGDFNALSPGQPLFDLVTPNPASSTITQATNIGNLNFVPDTQNPPPGCDPSGLLVSAASNRFGADVNWDFAAVHTFIDDVNKPVYIDVIHGDGKGSFTNPCDEYPLDTPPSDGTTLLQAYGIDTGSIDNGPYPDIVAGTWNILAANKTLISDSIGILLGKGDGTFQGDTAAQKAYLLDNDTDNIPANVMVVDLDADGFDDIVVADHISNTLILHDTITVHINALSISSGP